MRLLKDAFEYNGWATRQLGEVCRRLPSEKLAVEGEGEIRPILELWRHIDQVERAYLRLMGVAEIAERAGDLDGYLQSLEACRSAYVPFAEGLDDAGTERMFNIPWFGRDFTVGDGLFQVLTHSIEHRADVAQFLGRMGYDTPPIDYVAYIYLRDGGVMPQ